MLSRIRGFSYIELLITLIIIAVCIIPVMRMFFVLVDQVYNCDEMTTGMYLAKEGMEKLKNLGFTKAQLINLGDTYDPPLTEAPFILNKTKWRILRQTKFGTDPLEVHIKVFNAKNLKKPIIELVTLIEDLEWPAPVAQE